jgi:antitoxin PrlF
MPTATLTSKGQITIPREIRSHLRLKTGGRVTMEPKRIPFEQLFGFLHKRGRKPVTVRAMDRATAEVVRDDWKHVIKGRRS